MPSLELLLRFLAPQYRLQLRQTELPVANQIGQPFANERTKPHGSRQTTVPEPIRAAEPGPQDARDFGREGLGDHVAGQRLGREGGVVLGEDQAPLEGVLDALVQTVRGQGAMDHVGDVALHGADHADHDAHAKGPQLEPQGPRVRDHGAFAGAVDGPVDVRQDGGQGRDVDDEALRLDEKVGEGLAHGHDGEDIRLERLTHVVQVEIRRRMGVTAPAIESLRVS